jgi:hypothetical protein
MAPILRSWSGDHSTLRSPTPPVDSREFRPFWTLCPVLTFRSPLGGKTRPEPAYRVRFGRVAEEDEMLRATITFLALWANGSTAAAQNTTADARVRSEDSVIGPRSQTPEQSTRQQRQLTCSSSPIRKHLPAGGTRSRQTKPFRWECLWTKKRAGDERVAPRVR